MIRSVAMFMLLAVPFHAAIALPRHAPVPGGVAVLELGAAPGAQPAVSSNQFPQPVLRNQRK